MGDAKLLLPWGGTRLIDHVLDAWGGSRVAEVIAVVRRGDVDLTVACERHRVRVVHPDVDPEDMKASIQAGLREIEASFRPTPADRCFIAPADLPMLSSVLIDRLIATPEAPSRIVIPRFGRRLGHPALLPWAMTAEIFHLGPNEGVDQVVKRHQKLEVEFPADQYLMDVDTPEEYRRLRDAFDRKHR